MRQCRAVPFKGDGVRGLILAHCDFPNIDAHARNLRYPTDTLKISAFSLEGERLWQKDLGPGIVPGLWFCPVFPFDLDGDGSDEIYFVTNSNPDFPCDCHAMVLEVRNAATGELLRSMPWPKVNPHQGLQKIFRYFINGGYSNGRPRLITAQGTYDNWTMQCWDAELNQLWDRSKVREDPGACGSHMFPVLDIDGDGRDELFYGERCIDIDTGGDILVADEDGWWGHSDIVMPTLDLKTNRWSVYTCRELPQPEEARGVVMFDDHGRELWGHRNMQHVHTGWTARLCEDGTHRCYAMEMDPEKAAVLADHFYDVDGNKLESPFPLRTTLPVDFNGDGLHELVCGDNFELPDGECRPKGLVVDRHGNEMARVK